MKFYGRKYVSNNPYDRLGVLPLIIDWYTRKRLYWIGQGIYFRPAFIFNLLEERDTNE